MNKIGLIFSICFFLLNNAQAGLSCKLTNKAHGKIAIGTPVELELVFWPKSEFDLNAFQTKNVHGEMLIDSFFINKLSPTQISKYNEQAVVIKIEVVPLKAFDTKVLPMYVDEANNCMMEVESVSFISEKIDPKIVIISQPFDALPGTSYQWIVWVMSVFTVFLLVVLGIVIKKIILRRREKLKIELRREYFSHLFLNAESRLDFEKIYVMREEWEYLLESVDNGVRDFYLTLNKYQFQQEWSDEELEECILAFSKIREIWHA